MRTMYDAIGANAGALHSVNPSMVAYYLTGSADIVWSSGDVRLFPPNTTFVTIDQGGIGSPKFNATVYDVETGAWTIANAIEATKRSTAPRPTIYCDQSDYKTVPASYTGCLWIAAPGMSNAEAIALAKADPRIVAVQNVWETNFDISIVIDPTWPEKRTEVNTPETGPVTVVITWEGTDGLVSRKCSIPRETWDTLKFTDAS